MSENVKKEIVVPISGRIDSNSAPAAEAGIRAAIPGGADNLVLDAAKLEYVSYWDAGPYRGVAGARQ